MSRALRFVRTLPARPSVIVDLRDPARRTSSPWSFEELANLERGPIPIEILIGSFIAAWAVSEDYMLQFERGEITLRPKSGTTPSSALDVLLDEKLAFVIGAAGCGVPIYRGRGVLTRTRYLGWLPTSLRTRRERS